MKIADLKSLIKDLPDDYEVCVDAPDDEAGESIWLYPTKLEIDERNHMVLFMEAEG